MTSITYFGNHLMSDICTVVHRRVLSELQQPLLRRTSGGYSANSPQKVAQKMHTNSDHEDVCVCDSHPQDFADCNRLGVNRIMP